MRRIHVVGSTGSGKTILAAEISARLEIPHIELDSLYWQENWQGAEDEIFLASLRDALSGDAWVVDGNYSRTRPLIWERVDTVVWLDYPLRVNLGRLLRRSLKRIFLKELLWGRNRETVRALFISRESLFFWLFQTYNRRRRTYLALIADPSNARIRFVHLRSQSETNRWFGQISSEAGSPGG